MKIVPSLMWPEEFMYESSNQGSLASGNIYIDQRSELEQRLGRPGHETYNRVIALAHRLGRQVSLHVLR